MPHSAFRHIALKVTEEVQNAIAEQLEKAGWRPDETYVLEHGYCRSLYTSDPNGLLLEFTLDAPGIEASDAERRRTAHADFASWPPSTPTRDCVRDRYGPDVIGAAALRGAS